MHFEIHHHHIGDTREIIPDGRGGGGNLVLLQVRVIVALSPVPLAKINGPASEEIAGAWSSADWGEAESALSIYSRAKEIAEFGFETLSICYG